MLKKTMTYIDFDGNERTEDLYFNLTKAEITELELSHNGGLSALLKRLIQKQDAPEIVKIVKEIILLSYGEKSLDGRRFIKSPELREAFSQTQAYSDLFVMLSSDAEEAGKFINSIVPADLQDAIDKQEIKQITN